MLLLPVFVALTPLFTSAQISGDSSATAACAALKTAIPDKVFGSLDLQYANEKNRYWNAGLRLNNPGCIVMPESVEEVSTAVKTLNKYPDVKYAVKSGGHDPNPGHAAINGGVLISLYNLSGATYDNSTGLAYVKPGKT